MINWLKGSTKTQKSDLKNLPDVNMADWMTSGESAEFSKLLQDLWVPHMAQQVRDVWPNLWRLQSEILEMS